MLFMFVYCRYFILCTPETQPKLFAFLSTIYIDWFNKILLVPLNTVIVMSTNYGLVFLISQRNENLFLLYQTYNCRSIETALKCICRFVSNVKIFIFACFSIGLWIGIQGILFEKKIHFLSLKYFILKNRWNSGRVNKLNSLCYTICYVIYIFL